MNFLLKCLAINCVLSASLLPVCAGEPQDFTETLRQRLTAEEIGWMKEATRRQLSGCRVQATDGTWLYTPDGVGNYRALWTRDFAYMVEYAADLLPPEHIKKGIAYLLRGQRGDGCMPDRVNVDGRGVYAPGGEEHPLADHALDNGPFMAKLVCAYVSATGDLPYFREVEPAVRKGLDFTRRDETGLVYNPPDAPQCPYGFTDTIAKTGHELFCSLLYAEACRLMETNCRKAGCGEPDEYKRRGERIAGSLNILWDDSVGMYLAADRDCRQVDVWGSALAVHLGLAGESQSSRVARYLAANYEGIVQRGQIRHLPANEHWQRLLAPVAPGTYQNGAFWGTPIPWVAPVLARQDKELAVRLVREAIADYRERGITECVNGSYHNVPEYVASATNVYGLLRDRR